MTADLDPAGVDVAADITALPFEDGAFDAILCSHVLEHVEDDRAAMAELARVLRPGGWLLVLVPLDLDREPTYEDPAITPPRIASASSSSTTTCVSTRPTSPSGLRARAWR